MSTCMLIAHKDHNNIMQVYSVTVITHTIALGAGPSGQGTSEPITPESTPVLVQKFVLGNTNFRRQINQIFSLRKPVSVVIIRFSSA